MENENPLLLILLAIIGAASGILAWWQNRQTSKRMEEIQLKKVDSEAYDRAKIIFQASIDELEERIARLKRDLAEERTEKESLRARVEELEGVVDRLKVKLRIAGIELDNGNGNHK